MTWRYTLIQIKQFIISCENSYFIRWNLISMSKRAVHQIEKDVDDNEKINV